MASLPRPFGRYILEQRIAMGGMAEIFRGRTRQEGFAKTVCIKRVLPSFLKEEDFVKMFRDEAQLVARLQHANVVQVFDFGEATDEGEDEPSLYLAMELIDGCDLKKLISLARKRGKPIGIGVATQIAIEVCRGLHHAHSLTIDGRAQNLIHRDVSPHNILVSRQGEVKVTDFGIAKAAERATHTSTGIVKGKISYMAPEQLEGAAIDHRLDQFAAGVVFWEMLTGRRLFDGESDATILRQVMMCQVAAPSTVRSDIPAALEEVLLKALAPAPDDRFADMRAFEQALTRFLYGYTTDPAETDVRALVAELLDNAPARRTAVVSRPVAPAVAGPADAGAVPLAAAAALDENTPATSSDVFARGNSGDTGQSVPTDVDNTQPVAEEGISVSAFDATAALPTGEPFSNPPLRPEVAAAASATRTFAHGADASVAGGDVNAPAASDFTGSQTHAGRHVVAPGHDEKKGPPLVAMLAVGGLSLATALGVSLWATGSGPFDAGRFPTEQIPTNALTGTNNLATAGTAPLSGGPGGDTPLEIAAPVSNPALTSDAGTGARHVASQDPEPSAPVAEKETVERETVEKTKDKPSRRRRRAAPKTIAKAAPKVAEKVEPKIVTPTGTGILHLSVEDSWAYVYEGGKLIGETPVQRKFSAGKHTFLLKNPETGKSRTIDVVIAVDGKHREVIRGL